MSDFSSGTVRCPVCGIRFCLDDSPGGCPECPDKEEEEEEEEEE